MLSKFSKSADNERDNSESGIDWQARKRKRDVLFFLMMAGGFLTFMLIVAGAIAPVFASPAHPYTQALLSAVPLPDPQRERARTRIILQGDLPSTKEERTGCRFRARCPTFAALDDARRQACIEVDPPLTSHGPDHAAAGK